MHPAEVEAPFSPSKVLREIEEMNASFQIFQAAEVPLDQASAPETPEAPETQVPEKPIKAQKVEAQTGDVATGSPKPSAEEALLSRLVALEAEVLKLREPATSRPSPELSESPRRPAENAEKSEMEAHQAMSSLGMSLLSSSSLFASVSDRQEASPEHRDEEQKQSEASEVVQAEPEKALEAVKQAATNPEPRAPDPPEGEIIAEASEAGTLSQKGAATAIDETKQSATGTSRPSVEPQVQDVETEDVKGAAFFTPFAPRKDTAVQWLRQCRSKRKIRCLQWPLR